MKNIEMGIKIMSTSSFGDCASPQIVFKPDPNPSNYKILEHYKVNMFLIVLIQYNDVDNYEGKKLLIYENISINDLLLQGKIDPHFCESSSMFSPIARFEPTDRGLEWAYSFAGDK